MPDLRVIEVFDSLQGEGYWTGVPMTFVRLAGCNAPDLGLGCLRWCDTPDSWDVEKGSLLSVAEIVERVHFPRLCLTGGEPLLQAEGAGGLLAEAHRCGLRVHLETNGTIAPPLSAETFDWVVVSPKPPLYGMDPAWEGFIDELKLVVDHDLDIGTAERLAVEHRGAIVSVQPQWEAGVDRGFREKAVRWVLEHPGWRLSLQTHKLLGIR